MSTLSFAAALLAMCGICACQSRIGHPGESMTMQGCLSNENGKYVLKQDSGIEWQLVSHAVDLTSEVGHEILVRGAEVESTAAPGAPADASHGVHNELEVVSAKTVAPKCSGPAK